MTEKRENLEDSQWMAMILKDRAKKVITAPVPPTSPGDVFEERLKSGDCVQILVNCMRNIEKQLKELFLLAEEIKEKYIKGESNLSELTKAIDLISDKEKTRETQNFYFILFCFIYLSFIWVP